jgi:hypothetical protein
MNKQTVTQIKTVREKKFFNAFRDNHLDFLVCTGKEEGIQLRGECFFRAGFYSLPMTG